ncbi:HipA N-terminal domain-containing protein [Segetibacter sp.]|jgi:HipA-like protein|uniref:HipA N-terminal domain-containing protein n=1 Tax=Segetibacter sp. TaxID=2231182 RepID=UPI00261AC5D2|nr:HipA N-terminal domain-containing protein [Segetibacter sp.]MCW3081692.1 phosphatidylinositol kinase [Segetibacter sp.]
MIEQQAGLLKMKTVIIFPVSLTLPLKDQPYTSNVMFPFFDGLIPEGWLLDIADKQN